MKRVVSVSGGKTSSYIFANYPSDHAVFSLVTTDDKECLYPDKKIRKIVSDKIGKEFIGTLEMDIIIKVMLDLEQFVGKKIDWVCGDTFENIVSKPGVLPNVKTRYCTTELKLKPIFHWWYKKFNDHVEMAIGYRANEQRRAKKMIERLNKNGLLEIKETVSKHKNGRNKWQIFEWQKPIFPLIDAKKPIFKDQIEAYWKDKPVNFGKEYHNNCVGCFHRNPLLLKKMWETHTNKMNWFSKQEKIKKRKIEKTQNRKVSKYVYAQWKRDMTYEEIKNWKLQQQISFDDFSDCDSGFCGL